MENLTRPMWINPEIAYKVPRRLIRLPQIAYNFWWSWNREARNMFKKLDYPLWRSTGHNPVRMLLEMTPEQLMSRAGDPEFCHQYDSVVLEFDRNMSKVALWYPRTYPDMSDKLVAYFSAEFGLHQSLPIYSGGLGILSGDHCKEASDLGLPFLAIGFLYELGYFKQHIPSHGYQKEDDTRLDERTVPLQLVLEPDGSPLTVTVKLLGEPVRLRAYRVDVGRVRVYLMDARVEGNQPWAAQLTSRLYRGGQRSRIQQEILLGFGGVRLVRKLGYSPAIWHINEGHPAFMTLERVNEYTKKGMAFDEAADLVRKTTVFTTHTPVPAGHDIFAYPLISEHFGRFHEELGLTQEQFYELGSIKLRDSLGFNMTTLALKMSSWSNGVSQIHGQVSRSMFYKVWNKPTADEAPIGHVTNGVHVRSWIGERMHQLFTRYLGRNWEDAIDDQYLWDRLDIPLHELWEAHVELKRKLMGFVREQARRNYIAGKMAPDQVLASGTMLDPDALTIGFARRFATYKRATLLFANPKRLLKILNDPYRPVQIVFAGKAHPDDEPGKKLLQEVYRRALDERYGGRVAFLENYDVQVARYLVQGVDVWLNNPRPPQEASGTSGMKAAINGVLNLSVPDGWWPECFNGKNGWAIGQGLISDDWDVQDGADGADLYRLLEEQVIPSYYRRDTDGIPRAWAALMQESIRTSVAAFSARRMLKEYIKGYYLPAIRAINGNGNGKKD